MTMTGFVTDTNSFESKMDGWTTGGMGKTFERKVGSTPSSDTGPSSAADGSYYVYAETSSNSNTKFHLKKTFSGGQELYGVAFQYHMYGAAMGSAVLESSTNGTSWASLWTKSGNKGNQWFQATVYPGSGHRILRYTWVPKDCI